MKKIITIILCFCTLLLLCSCAKNTQSNTDNESNAAYESYKVKLEYYAKLVESLQNDIMEEKEKNFIAECAYRLKIDELEDEIFSLKKHGSFTKVDSDNSNDPPSDPDNREETPKQFEETAKKELFKIEVTDHKLTITEYLGDDSEVIIPQKLNEITVKAIGDEAFLGSNVSKVTIPEGVESIGWFAFSACHSLREIKIPATVTSVGYGAFDYCSPSLTIICEKGSYIEAYAKSWGIKVITE